MKHEPKTVLYVHTDGRVLGARTVSDADIEGKTQLLVGFGGKGMAIVEAVYSGGKGLGTWHYPDTPS